MQQLESEYHVPIASEKALPLLFYEARVRRDFGAAQRWSTAWGFSSRLRNRTGRESQATETKGPMLSAGDVLSGLGQLIRFSQVLVGDPPDGAELCGTFTSWASSRNENHQLSNLDLGGTWRSGDSTNRVHCVYIGTSAPTRLLRETRDWPGGFPLLVKLFILHERAVPSVPWGTFDPGPRVPQVPDLVTREQRY